MKLRLFLDKRQPRQDGRCAVRLSASQQRGGRQHRVFITTGVFVHPKDWDEAKERDRKSNANNALLRAYLDRAVDFIADCVKNGVQATPDALRDALTHAHARTKLVDYILRQAALKTAPSTRKLYEVTAEKVRAFDGGADDLTFEDITATWLHGFDFFMGATMRTNSRAIYLRNLRTVFNAAIDDGLTESYPFRRFHIRHEETRKRSLSLQQLRSIIASPPNQWRDMFLLMFYLQGINVSDLCQLTLDNVVGDRIEYRRAKTGHLFSIKIQPEAARLIHPYLGKRGEYLLDILERWQDIGAFKRKMNKRLKALYPDMPPLSSYWARHTYATLLAEIDTPVEVISMALGHSIGSRVTQIYIRQDLRKVDEANRRLFDYVNGVTC